MAVIKVGFHFHLLYSKVGHAYVSDFEEMKILQRLRMIWLALLLLRVTLDCGGSVFPGFNTMIDGWNLWEEEAQGISFASYVLVQSDAQVVHMVKRCNKEEKQN